MDHQPINMDRIVDAFITDRPINIGMRVREWQDIVRDVIDSNVDSDGWQAVAGNRATGIGEDLYIGHPKAGLYLLKTYAKNPYQVRGVGTQVARSLDDEIGSFLPAEKDARFAIQSPPDGKKAAINRVKRVEETIRVHSETPTSSDDFFVDLMSALESPAFGPLVFDAAERPDPLDNLASTFEEAEEMLNSDLDSFIEEDEVDRGFM